MSALLAANLAALARVDPALAERLTWPVESSHVLRLPDGRVGYRHHQTVLPLELDAGGVTAALPASRTGPLFVFGAGLGELPAAWLDGGGGPVTAWERDPWLLRLVLSVRDWTAALTARALVLKLGVDLLISRPGPGIPVAHHPLLSHVYRNERLLLDDHRATPLAFMAAGGLFVEDVSDALRAHGFRVYTLDLQRVAAEESTQAVQRARPAVLVGINHVEGLAGFSEAEHLSTLEWEIDPALTRVAPAGGPTSRTHVFTWRRANVEEFRDAGFTHVTHLPLAADVEHRAPPNLTDEERARYTAPVAFVGASMADRTPALRRDFVAAYSAWRPGRAHEAEPLLDEVLAAQRADFSRYRVPALLAERAPGWTVPRGAVEPERLVGELAAAERRLAFVGALAPLGVQVWGDAGWRQAPGVQWRGPAGHTTELNKVYASARVNVDLGRLYQLDIITMRVFDVLACGGFVLAEHCDDLAECFQVGEEVESWRTLEELTDKARWYLAHPDVAAAMAAKGHAAVRARHTIRQRVGEMLKAAGAARPGSGA